MVFVEFNLYLNQKVVDPSFIREVKYIHRNKGNVFMEGIFLETFKNIMVASLDYFTHFSAGTCIRR